MFLESLDYRKVTNKRTFWKRIQPFFSEKRKTVNKITLVNKNEGILFNDKVVSDGIKRLFKNATRNLEINENPYIVDNSNGITDQVNKPFDKFKIHPNTLLVEGKVANDSPFSFNKVSFGMIHI